MRGIAHVMLFAAILTAAPTVAEESQNQTVIDNIKTQDQTLQRLIRQRAGPEAAAADDARRLLMQSAADGPAADIEVYATAKDGGWSVSYWADKRMPIKGNVIALPVGKVATLNVTSGDLIYEMAFPDLALEFDAIPGRLNAVTIRPEKPGVLTGQCASICGAFDAKLVLHFMTPQDYTAWRTQNGLPAD